MSSKMLPSADSISLDRPADDRELIATPLPLKEDDIKEDDLKEDEREGEPSPDISYGDSTGDEAQDSDSEEAAEDEKSWGVGKASPSQNRLKKWWLVPAVGLVVALGGLSYMRVRNSNAPPPPAAAAAAVSVQTAAAETAPIRAWTSSEGLVQAVRFKHLAFDTAGDVTYIADKDGRTLRAGDPVSAGELLAQVDDRTLQADVNQARAALSEARERQAAAGADVASAQAQVAAAQAQVDQALAQLDQAQSAGTLAQTNLDRYQTLYNQGAISAAERDSRLNTAQDSSSQVAAARSQVAAARSQVNTAQAQVAAARGQQQALDSQIATAQARLEQAQVALEDTQLYAPFDGIVAYMNLRENEYYTPQSVSSQLGQDYGAILDRVPIVVVDPSQYEVIADFAAYRGEQVEPSQTALVTADQTGATADNLPGRADARGQVTAVNPAVNPGERSIEVTALMTSSRSALKHGQNVTMWAATANEPSATVVPINAVVYRDQQPYVFVVNSQGGNQNNTVEQRRVEVGIEGLNKRQIISGVTEGEQVVVSGQNRLVDGAGVQVVNNSFTASSEEGE